MAKTKKLIFQDVDFENNKILNPSSIENIGKDPNDENTIKVAKVSMSPISINSEADTISLKNNNNNYISLKKEKVNNTTTDTIDIKTSEAKIIGTVNINDNKVLVSNSDYNISGLDVNIENYRIDNNDTIIVNKKVSIIGPNSLSIQSNKNGTSEITSSYVHAVEESSSNQFLVKEKVCITWDDKTKSLLFIQR